MTCEATPHHFALTDADMPPYDSNYKMKPPLRSRGRSRRGRRGHRQRATIDAIATDHAPHPGSEKMQEFERCPFGIIGLETAIGAGAGRAGRTGQDHAGAHGGVVHDGPGAVLRLGRGTLAPGAPGDVTVFSTDVEWTYDVNQSASRSRNSPFHGRTFRGGPMATVVDGEIKWRR